MKIINAQYIYIDGNYKQNYAIAFDDRIEDIGEFDNLKNLYPNAEIILCEENSVLYAGFINTHTHLEFSANKSKLKYGSFMQWLYSVIKYRDELMNSCDEEIMDSATNEMLKSGVTSFGAISSLGLDLKACVKAPQRVVFFNELIGSNPQSVDALYQDFLQRFEASSLHKKDLITPAVAIHSPYSVHPIVVKRGISLAKTKNVPLTAHLLESKAEKDWLDSSSGEFKAFFEEMLKQDKAVTSIDEFISSFDGYPTLFSHFVEADGKNRDKIKEEGHFIAHCPRSNRFLGCDRLKIEELIKLDIPFNVATDGLSSNYSLNIFDELRSALMLHHLGDINLLAKKLIDSVTLKAGQALKLDCGEIKKGYFADFTITKLPQSPSDTKDIPLWTILHTKEANGVYIGGKKYV